MITDGVDDYERRYDPEDPYVEAAINDSVRAHLVVYSIYWRDQGRFDRTGYAANDGQNLLAQLTQVTGGNSYWRGDGNPVNFEPYFADIDRRIDNQYELDFTAPMGLIGIWLWYFLTQLEKRPLMPLHEPQLEEALAHGRE